MDILRKLFTSHRNETNSKLQLDLNNIPKHIAVIMDGNGRWAKSKGLPRTAGHKAGVEALRDVIRTASDIGVAYLTLYAFSTENWKRPKEEVTALMQLLVTYLRLEIKELHSNNVKICTIGDISKLPDSAIREINDAVNLTKENTGLQVNIALNYGGRDEIIRAVKRMIQAVEDKTLTIDDVDESIFSQYLYTQGIPDPDLIIRPSGEYRISNFLLWQIAYSEFWFSDIYWPDFNGEHLIHAIHDYQNRERRFGGIK
ncbi:MAG: isoprenyl transferase [Bacillota bacterium]